MVQQFFRSSPASMPCINPAACRTGSYRLNRGAIRSITSLNASCHRVGSTLSSAAIAALSLFHTSKTW